MVTLFNKKNLIPALALALSTLISSSYADEMVQRGRTTLLKSAPVQIESKYSENQIFSPFASWGLNPENAGSIRLLEAWKNFHKNNEVIVAVIDTGIDYNHPFLKNNIYTPNSKTSDNNYGIDFSAGSSTPEDKGGYGKVGYFLKRNKQPIDQHGHGTHVSGIIKSVFPDVKILPLKYYNPNATGQVNLDSTIKALQYAVDMNVDIINYSGGGPEPSIEELRILKKAEEKGILVIAAAGNEKSNIDNKSDAYYPASYGLSNIITVAAHNQNSEKISSSNWGKNSVDLSAPGKRIQSALPGGKVGSMTGTSQATAFVSGVAALIKAQYAGLTPEEVKAILVNSTTKVANLMQTSKSGGILNAGNALSIAKEKYSTSNVASIIKNKKAAIN